MFFFFFFYWSPDHPDLHSFPTRRSSDLSSLVRSQRAMLPAPTSVADASGGMIVTVVVADRSEEHTSELQSRENLVCRLLLEKKKKKKNNNNTTSINNNSYMTHPHSASSS